MIGIVGFIRRFAIILVEIWILGFIDILKFGIVWGFLRNGTSKLSLIADPSFMKNQGWCLAPRNSRFAHFIKPFFYFLKFLIDFHFLLSWGFCLWLSNELIMRCFITKGQQLILTKSELSSVEGDVFFWHCPSEINSLVNGSFLFLFKPFKFFQFYVLELID